MTGDFTETTLGRLLSFANGRSSPIRADSMPYPVYGSNGVIGRASETNADEGSIIIGRVGSYCGSLYLSKQRCWVTDNAIRATALDDNDSRFLFYLLGMLSLNSWRAGSGQPLLNQDILSRIPAAVPEPAEQHAIAHILGTLDDKIELNRRMNEALEAMARALFKSWFVNFDPVRAKMEGRDTGLPQHIAGLFPDRLVDSELGEIPEGWKVKPTTAQVSIVGGGTPKTAVDDYWGGDIPWFSVVDTPTLGSVYAVTTEKTITQLGMDESSARLVPEGTTIISARGTVGNLAMCGSAVAFNQSCYGLRASSDGGDHYVFLLANNLVDRLHRMAHGSVFSTITRRTIEAISVAVASRDVLLAFEGIVQPIFARIKANVKEPVTLSETRDGLLPQLISGELRVRGAKRFIGRTA